VLTFSRLKYLYFAYFSKPRPDRALYRAAGQTKARRILEIGLGSTARSFRLIDLAVRAAEGDAVRYTAIDLFEARATEEPGLSLKEAHRLFKPSGAQVQLIPGDAASALRRAANSLQNMDLVIISAGNSEAALTDAWFYVPRMLHDRSLLLQEQLAPGAESPSWVVIPTSEINARAAAQRRPRAA
jgi:hypothetical protein